MASCKLQNVDVLKTLVNLTELNLSQNPNIDITPLQYLMMLTKLKLKQCELRSVEALIPLQKLKVLHLNQNLIVYARPLEKLKSLVELKIVQNKIIDLSPQFSQLFNIYFCSFDFKHPTLQEIERANIYRNINSPITLLRNMNSKHIQLQNSRLRWYNSINQFINVQVSSLLSVTEKVVQYFKLQICFENLQ
ncbi:leucine-rich_repeat domain-containing protein [Hexamita inflata]|uniref:Leucine-rich repeat domain-containing protein n=1 Tax=Hexamita inflata TaxID=28002 RepID=A0AA86QYY6_9EUKA|nr:leucine-rich repeat domain-containing protein [Hexamita inflata]